MNTVLIIEDDRGARQALSRAIEKIGYRVLQADDGPSGLELAQRKRPEVVLCDIRLPGMDGIEVLQGIKKSCQNQSEVIMMTAYGTIELAVKALKLGAYDFLEKPITDLDMVRQLVKRAMKEVSNANTGSKRSRLLHEVRGQHTFCGIVGQNIRMKEIFETILKIAPSRATVVITGETGTGKDLVARAIHQCSGREGPFVAVNLSAFAETLIESELFGYVKGAHSTAFKDRKGRFEEAEGGTLFLDEIGDIPEHIQVKLLRVIENREIERLGEYRPIKVDVRFVAATNVDLEKKVAQGQLRSDLYYRLKALRLHIPPLRERPDDIPLLVDYFIQRYNKENNRHIRGVDKETLELLTSYHWPGNVREMEKALETAVVMAEGDLITPELLPLGIRQSQVTGDVVSMPVGTKLKDMEKLAIRQTLAHVGGNKTKAAKILGIGTRTLYRKIEEYNL